MAKRSISILTSLGFSSFGGLLVVGGGVVVVLFFGGVYFVNKYTFTFLEFV